MSKSTEMEQQDQPASSPELAERLRNFFLANPHTINTARQIAIRTGKELSEIENALAVLASKSLIQKIPYPGAVVFRCVTEQ